MSRRHPPVQALPPKEGAHPPLAPRRARPQLRISRHAKERARQRGYRLSDLPLVVEYGSPVHDGFILTARDVARAQAEVKQVLDRLPRLVNVFVPIEEGLARTIYLPAAPKRRRRLEEATC